MDVPPDVKADSAVDMSRSSACAPRSAKSQQRRRIEWTHGANGLTLINLMRIVLSLLVLLGQAVVGQPVASRDFTADGLFTRNIEGPGDRPRPAGCSS